MRTVAEQHGLSTTPVREALARLTGEGLVEERRDQGHFAPKLDPAIIGELYDLLEAALILGCRRPAAPLRRTGHGWEPPPDGRLGSQDLVEWLKTRRRRGPTTEIASLVSARLGIIANLEQQVIAPEIRISTVHALLSNEEANNISGIYRYISKCKSSTLSMYQSYIDNILEI